MDVTDCDGSMHLRNYAIGFYCCHVTTFWNLIGTASFQAVANSLNSRKLPGRFSYGLGTRLLMQRCDAQCHPNAPFKPPSQRRLTECLQSAINHMTMNAVDYLISVPFEHSVDFHGNLKPCSSKYTRWMHGILGWPWVSVPAERGGRGACTFSAIQFLPRHRSAET